MLFAGCQPRKLGFWDFGIIVSQTFHTEKTHMQFSHELLYQRIMLCVRSSLFFTFVSSSF